MGYPNKIFHWISDQEVESSSNQFFNKINPANGEVLGEVASGNGMDVEKALQASEHAYREWSRLPVIRRSDILRQAVFIMMAKKEELAEIVALESGKSKKDALGEVGAAIECGFFFAGEGRRYFGEVLQSATPNREVKMIRQSIGIGTLITPFNNPASGVAWKIFPALLCGNSVVIKSHEDTPYVALWFAKVFKEAGVPSGVISVLQGLGPEVGAPLVEDPRVKFVSLTGSVATGQKIIKACADRLAKVSIEAGGKNPFVVCDDADMEKAVAIAAAAGFVDGGQRCAAASRMIIFDSVYEEFKNKFLEKIKNFKIGAEDGNDYGAIINEKRMNAILEAIEGAKKRGASILCGGNRIMDDAHKNGFFIAPTVLENVPMTDKVSCDELFGPVVILYKVKDFEEALAVANNAKYKLSGAIHTRSINRAQEFINRYEAGVVRVNGPTQGSEAHMPFGGLELSGNGWREPGTKALEFYSEWKQISIDHDPAKI